MNESGKISRQNRIYLSIISALILFMLYSRIQLINSYSIDLDGVEFMFIHYIQNILHHKGMYTAINQFPFDTSIHMPLYSVMMAKLFEALNITKVNQVHEQLILCRIVSFCFLFVSLYYLVKLLWSHHQDKIITLLVSCFFMLYLTGHFYSARQDAIKTSLFLMFLYFSLTYLKDESSKKHLLFSFLSCLGAINTKQDSIIYISIALGIAMLIYKSKKSALLFLSFIAATLLSYSILYSIYGYKFIENTILLNLQINKSNIASYNFLMFIFSLVRSLPVVVLLIFLHRKNYENIQSDRTLRLLIYLSYSIYFIAHLLTFRASSYINYTHEAMALIIVTIGILMKNMEFKPKLISYSIILSLLLILSNLIIHAYPIQAKGEKKNQLLYTQNLKNKPIIDSIIKNDITFFTTCNNTIYYPEKNLIYGYDFHIDRFIYSYLGLKTETSILFLKNHDYDTFFKDGRVKYIITNNNSRDKEILTTYYTRFKPYKKVENLEIFSYTP